MSKHTSDIKRELDDLDGRLLAELSDDGQASAGKLADNLGVTAPTVRSRLKSLIADGVLKVAGLVDPFRAKGMTVALVCVTVQSHELLDATLTRIAALEKVHWAAVVTGRYDIMVEVVLSEDINDLYLFLEELSGVGGIQSSESFVVMKAKRKWALLPDKVRSEFKQPKGGRS